MRVINQILRTSYPVLLSKNEWEQFRSNIVSAQKYCELCRLGGKTLQVHHWAYDPARKPWEYSREEVAVLCVDCHRQMHEVLNDFRRHVFPKVGIVPLRVLNGALAVALSRFSSQDVACAIAQLVSQPDTLGRFAEEGRREYGKHVR